MHNHRRHRVNTLPWLLLAVVLLVLCVYPGHVQAQQPVDMQRWSHLIYTNQSPVPLRTSGVWDSASRWLWTRSFQYNTQTGQVILSAANHPHPSQGVLPDTVLTVFGIDISDPDHPRAYYSVSPNGEYVAYSVVANDGAESPNDDPACVTRRVRIAHIPSLTIKDINLKVSSGVEYNWYGDSTGLLVSNYPPCTGEGDILYGYVTSLSPNLASISATDLFPWDISIDGAEIIFEQATHASRDGSQILLRGVSDPTGNWHEMTAVLALLDIHNPTNTRILFEGEQIPLDAFFKYGDESKLLIITTDGFVEYDLETKQTIVLDRTFNGIIARSYAGGGTGLSLDYEGNHYVLDSTISPNGRWLIYAHPEIDTGTYSFYVVDLAEALYGNGTAGNTPPTDLPTFTPVCSSDGC